MSALAVLLWALAVIAVIVAVLLVVFVALLVWMLFVPRGRSVKARKQRREQQVAGRSHRRRKGAPRRSVVLPLPIPPGDLKAARADLGHEHEESVAWAQSIERDSRVHLVFRVPAYGDLHVERVRITRVLDQEEPAQPAFDGCETANAPLGRALPAVEVTPDRPGNFSDERGRRGGDDRDDNAAPDAHSSDRTRWAAAIRALATSGGSPLRVRLSVSARNAGGAS